jgi:hypothetical protein
VETTTSPVLWVSKVGFFDSNLSSPKVEKAMKKIEPVKMEAVLNRNKNPDKLFFCLKPHGIIQVWYGKVYRPGFESQDSCIRVHSRNGIDKTQLTAFLIQSTTNT